jgi:hypothetical protein
MANRHRLDGLFKWAGRPQWAEEMQEMADQHLVSVCEAYDVDPDELAGLIGDAAFLNLWGCIFEDLVAHDFGGRNIADDYLKRRGWKESAGGRAYIKALRDARMSLYEVSGIRRDEGFFAHDLLRGGGPVWVNERRATHGLAQWDRIAVRVVEVNGRVEVAGAVLSFSREASKEVIAAFEEMKGSTRRERAEMAADLIAAVEADGELPPETDKVSFDELKRYIAGLAGEADDEPLGIERALETGAFQFTNIWLEETLDRLTDRSVPQLQNTDGEPIESTWIEYPLARGAKQADIRTALSSVPALRPEGRNFWNWLETAPKEKGRRQAVPEGVQTIMTQTDDGATVLGTLELKGRVLMLAANSQGRAERGRALVEKALGGLVGDPAIESQTGEEMLAGARARARAANDDGPGRPGPDVPEDVRAAVAEEFFGNHYARVLDEPVRVLGDISPRKAVTTAEGREKVVEWLKGVENHHARQAMSGGLPPFDCGWMWEELGLSARRA